MKLFPAIKKAYGNDDISAADAQRKAEEIAFGPVVFQVARVMLDSGILGYLGEHTEGSELNDIIASSELGEYAVKVLMEASLSIGLVHISGERFRLSKTGWFLLNDKMVGINMKFINDVNYLGLFRLEESLINGRPEGLKVFGEWDTIYEGLSSLPEKARRSWYGFDHFYSDISFDKAIGTVFSQDRHIKNLLDVGGNTGKWALKCVQYRDDVHVTVMDLPQQIKTMAAAIEGQKGADRITGYSCNLIDKETSFPKKIFDAIWMSQFLDCFSETEIISILKRAALCMDSETRLYILDIFWDRQKFETASFCLTMTSVYFAVMANGNSKMYHSEDILRCISLAGLEKENIIDCIGPGHSLIICRKKNV